MRKFSVRVEGHRKLKIKNKKSKLWNAFGDVSYFYGVI